MAQLRHLLVANRGEIALRILRTARALGYRTTAIYSEADAFAPHVDFADDAVLIGPAAVSASYLNAARIVEAARSVGADAVHPGYGLLSENAGFARACVEAGLVFVGPRAETIELMGHKGRARIAIQAIGVRCVAGYDGEEQSDATLVREAQRVGFPLMVKAAAGGGGRGMRRVTDASALPEAIARARSEAKNAFGDERLILERAIEGARHVEVQVFGDSHGQVIHLGERDCSVQRRFQKVIEEAPSPAVGAELRQRMGEVAVLVAKSCGYVGAGTVELLLDPGGHFYFLEMNTRLQVEHPVTESISGIDLVAWQLRIAEGEPLPLTQAEVQLRGHAMEARLYAEEPNHGFVPSTGRIVHLYWPQGDALRIDHGLREGLVIGSHYDPLLAKIIVHATDRDAARRKLCAALRGLRVLGVQTNQSFLLSVLQHERFVAGHATTDFLDRDFDIKPVQEPSAHVLSAAALIFIAWTQREAAYPAETAQFTNCVGLGWPVVLEVNAECFALTVEPDARPGTFLVRVRDTVIAATLVQADAAATVLLVENVRTRFEHAWDGVRLWLQTATGALVFRDRTAAAHEASQAHGDGRALAPMDGAVIDVAVRVGDNVCCGQTLAVVEAMKLELRVAADLDGVVIAVYVQRGDQVKARQLLIEVQAAAPSAQA